MVQVMDICSARRKLGLSQEQLAEALGVSRNTIGRWERGECAPNADKLTELERMLAQHDVRAVPEDTPTPVPDAEPAAAPAEPPQEPAGKVPPSAKAKRWPLALLCAGIACALLIGIIALTGVYSIKQQSDPVDSAAPIEEVEIKGREVDEFPSMPGTLRPLQP